ncbi:hypothetical protein [Amycolatopsis anabasis]|uniref:hypothetical protein n=1 Tax=Amycolatopsis anabasis TaxID=1840409 RepID=UPI00131C5A20|nr:hypothetical protein [Amycolatopsis anabasis]
MTELIEHVAKKLAAWDWEHSGHQEPEDFYEGMAEVAVRSVHDFREETVVPTHPNEIRPGQHIDYQGWHVEVAEVQVGTHPLTGAPSWSILRLDPDGKLRHELTLYEEDRVEIRIDEG